MSNTQKNVVVTLADGSVAATQSASDNSTKVATTAYADAAGGSSTPRMTISTCFEDQSINFNRFDKSTTNGAATMNTTGLLLDTNATQGGDANVTLKQWSTTDIFGSNPIFDAIVYRSSAGTDYHFYAGTGAVNNSEITGLSNLTTDQMGFKFIMASSSETKYATNGNGTTETAGAITHTWSTGHHLHCVKDSTTNIKFYVDKVLKSTSTTNLPDTAHSELMNFLISNMNVATETNMRTSFASLSWDSE